MVRSGGAAGARNNRHSQRPLAARVQARGLRAQRGCEGGPLAARAVAYPVCRARRGDARPLAGGDDPASRYVTGTGGAMLSKPGGEAAHGCEALVVDATSRPGALQAMAKVN